MKKIAYIPATLLLTLLFATCSGEEKIPQPGNQPVEIMFSMDNYTKVVTTTKSASATTTRATEVGSDEENTIIDLNLFLFDTDGQNPKSYYFSILSSGTWIHDTDERKGNIKLDLTQAEAGKRQVYIVANYGADLSGASAAISSVDDLEGKLFTNNNPWSPNLSTPILMSGFKGEHDFIEKRILGDGIDEPVHLIRALAKVELNIELKTEHQSKPIVREGDFSDPYATLTDKPQYHYAFLNFDKNTLVVNPATVTKQSDLTAPDAMVDLYSLDESSWVVWNTLGTYMQESDEKVTALKLVTYINERDEEAGRPLSSIGISMPYEGDYPPPQFGPDITQIFLPDKIKRNHWYVYDVEL